MQKLIISLALTFGLVLPAVSDVLKLRDDAPKRYVVVKGDTLWGLSNYYLKNPWRWPQLWNMNRDQIKNPHWIYPGDVLQLRYVKGQPRLSLEKGQPREVKLSPKIRSEERDKAIASIPADAIEPFLKRPLIIIPEELKRAPKLVAAPDERIILSLGDRVYATGVDQAGTWQAYRLGKELLDPDTKASLGYEAIYGGDLIADKVGGDIQALYVRSVVDAVLVGDHLLHIPKTLFVNYVPHPAKDNMKGKIVSVYSGVNVAAPLSTIVLNLGSDHGVELGHVFGLFKQGGHVTTTDTEGKEKQAILPMQQTGEAFVYRAFNKLSYALILNSTLPVYIGDIVASPESSDYLSNGG